MRIVSWNCNGAFREKYKLVKALEADVYVIQECEKPEKYYEFVADFCPNYIWTGEKESKGLCVFAKDGIQMVKNDWKSYCLRHFLSARINNAFDLLGVWTGAPYIEEYYIYQTINLDRYSKNLIIAGDFNSNAKWDKEHGSRNHSAVVRQLEQLSLASAYHYVTGEKQGEETKDTFYMYRKKEKGFHIDFCFANTERILDFRILQDDFWLNYSDHLPLQLDFTE